MAANATSTQVSSPHLATSEILFNSILLATDFSKPAHQALRVAMSVGHAFHAKLLLVHATVPMVFDVESGPIPEDVLTANLDSDKKEMEHLIADEAGLREMQPTQIVSFGEVVELVNTACHDHKIDLVVIGSHGASGFERLALGSVAESVLHRSTCPVMIVGPKCSLVEHPFRSILFSTDLTSTGLRAAQYAAGLAERFHSRLTMLHVAHRGGVDAATAAAEKAHRELEQLLPQDISQYCKTELLIATGKPADEILATSKSIAASLIVVGLKDRPLADHATWSTFSHVIREANCPVLGVKSHL